MKRKRDALSALVEQLAEAVVRHLQTHSPAKKKRRLSAAGKARIAAAARKRWAAYRRQKQKNG